MNIKGYSFIFLLLLVLPIQIHANESDGVSSNTYSWSQLSKDEKDLFDYKTARIWRRMAPVTRNELLVRKKLWREVTNSIEQGEVAFYKLWTKLGEPEKSYVKMIIDVNNKEYAKIKAYSYKNVIMLGHYITAPELALEPARWNWKDNKWRHRVDSKGYNVSRSDRVLIKIVN